MEKLYDRINWHNDTTPALNESNLNRMDRALDEIDDRVVELSGTITEDVPEIKEYLDQAEDLVERIETMTKNPPYIGANGNWYVFNTNTMQYEDSGIDASITVEIADITMLPYIDAPYVTNSGTNTDPVFHLYIPRAATISSVEKTQIVGNVDTYTMTLQDGSTFNFTVTNGTGSGDMKAVDYDPQGTVSTAGGMIPYFERRLQEGLIEGNSHSIDQYAGFVHAEGAGAYVGQSSKMIHIEGTNNYVPDQIEGAHCEGTGSTASGTYCHVEGLLSYGSGDYCHIEGRNCVAQGDASHAEGSSSTAKGYATHAEGSQTYAVYSSDHAEGSVTCAKGSAAHAEGEWSKAIGEASHAEGTNTTANYRSSHAEGSSTYTYGVGAHAEGNGTRAIAMSAHSEGGSTTAAGSASHAEGQQTYALMDAAHAEGAYTCATGYCSHAEGESTTAYGMYSHAEGNLSCVTGNGSYGHAGGYNSKANGNYVFAHGYNCEASAEFSFVIGKSGEAPITSSYLSRARLFAAGHPTVTRNGILNELRIERSDDTLSDIFRGKNSFSVDIYGNTFMRGAPFTAKGVLYNRLIADGDYYVLEDGAAYVLWTNTRMINNNAWRGAQAYYIVSPFAPSAYGVGASTTALAVAQHHQFSSIGTAGLTLKKDTVAYTNPSTGATNYHARIGIGSCVANCCVRYALLKIIGSELDMMSNYQ